MGDEHGEVEDKVFDGNSEREISIICVESVMGRREREEEECM